MKILVITPHPDDEVLGCGGTIAKYGEHGDEVYLCVVTKAYSPEWSEEFIKNRPREVEAAGDVLGIKNIYFLDFLTVKLDSVPQKELIAKIYEVIKKVEPDVMYIPHIGDLNKDHRLVFEASLVAARPINNRIKKILSYEILSSTEWGAPIVPFVPNVYEEISSDDFEKKMKAMAVYESELKIFPHPRSPEAIEVLAKKRGTEAGLKLAEAFMLLREISI